MAIEAFLFFGVAFVILLVLAWRNGAFERRGRGDLDGRARTRRSSPVAGPARASAIPARSSTPATASAGADLWR